MSRIPRRPLARSLALLLPLVLLWAGWARHRPRAADPPYTPQEALKTFRIEDGFRIELFAAEPLISDPVAMEVDEQGRMYVVEMHGYPLDTAGSGRVMLLSDGNGDGLPDRSVVFADGLRLPTGILRWGKGVLVTDSPDVLYLEDTDGDGRADVRRAMLTGFALSNPQHNTNTPVYGLDNWIYLANEGPVRTIRYQGIFGDEGSEVHFPGVPGGPRLPPDGGGRNVRFRPDTHQLEMLSARSQFGQTFDRWGHHFLVTNNRHVYQEVVPAPYLARNPDLVVPSVVHDLPDYRIPADVFPITEKPEFQLLTDVGVMTSASGLTYYLGDLFPSAYRNATFVAEGAHNLVRVDTVSEAGVTFRASRMRDDREFLASTDSWFRPVNFYVGPDGALYLIDYYRRILEHPEWLDDRTAQSADLYAGRDRGRIYRIVPEGAPAAAWADRLRLGDAPVAELVRLLEHPNVWWRRTAQRLLVDRKPDGAVAPLARLAGGSRSPEGRVHALWTLQGLGRVDRATIERALGDPHPGVRENALRVAELHLPRTPALADRLVRMAGEPHPRVRFQLLLSLGWVDTPAAEAARQELLLAGVEDPWMQIAGLSAASRDRRRLFATARQRLSDRETPGRRALFGRLAAMTGAGARPAEVHELVRSATAPGEAGAWWRAAVLEGLAGGLRSDAARGGETEPSRELLARAVFGAHPPAVRRAALRLLETTGLPAAPLGTELIREATRLASARGATPESRADAIRLLVLDDAAKHVAVLRQVTGRQDPPAVQAAAVLALGRLPGEEIGRHLLERWPEWTPSVREEAIRAMVRDQGRVRVLLDAVAAGRVRVTEVDRSLRIRLMMNDDDALRARARSLFGDSSAEAAGAVERYRAALTLEGNVDRGRQVFTRVCSACHQYRGGSGTAFGPDLGEVRNRLPYALLGDILHPNRSIADGYELWLVELSDGSTLSGVVGGETPTSVTFRRPGAAEITVARERIRSMSIAEMSAMPEGLDAQIGEREMADLIAYLKGGK